MPAAPRSESVPFIEGEDASDRHARRLGSAMDSRAVTEATIRELGGQLVIRNAGQHWTATFEKKLVIEWWPSSGRVVIDRSYGRPRKAHDCEQFIAIVRELRRA